MRIRALTSWLVTLMFLSCGTPQSRADMVALNEAATTSVGIGGDFNVGYEFQVGPQDLELFSMGLWDLDLDGFNSPHQVSIWSVAAPGAPLRSVIVPAGTTGTLGGDFRFGPVAPLVLLAGTNYRIAFNTFNEPLHFSVAPPTSPLGPEFNTPFINFVDRAIATGTAFPTHDGIDGTGWDANFQFTVAVVPEPGSCALLAGSGLAFLIIGWRRLRPRGQARPASDN